MDVIPNDPRIAYGMDRLVMRAGRLFGWGWAVHFESRVLKVELCLGEGRDAQCLSASYGLMRDDVAKAFPAVPHAGMSGFVVTGYATRLPAGKPSLRVHLEDGSRLTLAAGDLLEFGSEHRRRLKSLAWLSRSVWRRLRRFDLKGIVARARAQGLMAPTLDEERALPGLLSQLGGMAELFVILDHNMGGGANQFRERLVDEKVAAGVPVVLCTYILPTLDYRLHVRLPGRDEAVFRVSSFLALEALIDCVPAVEVFLNSPVSFDDPLLLAQWLGQLRQGRNGVRLTVTVHDYFMVCPSFVLLDADGHYCGIPAIERCAACIARHQASYVILSPPTRIPVWRGSWARCLDAADEVRCFSDSTRTLLQRAYPDLDPRRVSVVPHRVDFIPERLPRINHDAPLALGIIGQISVQKGAGMVADMIGLIEKRGVPIRVVVIGTLDATVHSERLTVTGPYRRDDLVGLIEQFGLNLFLFPSICPETFSYTTEEMIRLDLPVVAFDLGAPADRLRGYRKGRICAGVSAEDALASVLEFHRELQSCHPSAA